jgi:excisionase family DNA binding protein
MKDMPKLMTIEELEQYLCFTRKTIYKLLKQNSVPAIKIGNKWRFDKEAIDDWLHHNIERVKARILVIDDDELIRSLFKETLEEQGHKVETVDDTTVGLTYVRQRDYNLVFLDLKMSGTDGAEILGEMRKVNSKLPVIIITGYPNSEMMERAMKQGPLGVMLKPFTDSDIRSAVSSFLFVNKQTER